MKNWLYRLNIRYVEKQIRFLRRREQVLLRALERERLRSAQEHAAANLLAEMRWRAYGGPGGSKAGRKKPK